MAKERSEVAVVAALAPVCTEKFRAQPDAAAKTVALSKVNSWKRAEEFPKEFVTLPGETYPSSAFILRLLHALAYTEISCASSEGGTMSKEWEGKPGKLQYFSPNRGAGD